MSLTICGLRKEFHSDFYVWLHCVEFVQKRKGMPAGLKIACYDNVFSISVFLL